MQNPNLQSESTNSFTLMKKTRKINLRAARFLIVQFLIISLFNRAARSPQGPGTKSTMDESKSESKTTTNGKETSDIDKWKSESRAKAHGQMANEHRLEKPEKDTKTVPRNRKLAPRRPQMAPQEAKNRPKKGRRGCKNDPKPQVEPRSAPRLPQDRPGTPPKGRLAQRRAPPGDPYGRPETTQNGA